METGTLAYQPHSATSKEAAERNVTATAVRTSIFNLLYDHEEHGATADEIALMMAKIPNMVSSRLHELEVDGCVVKLALTRLTRHNRPANVYVTKDHIAGREVLPVKQGAQVAVKQLEAAHKLIEMLLEVTPVEDYSPMFQARFKTLCKEANYVAEV